MTTVITSICLLLLVAVFAFRWGHSDGEEKGYQEGLEDGAQLFRGSLTRLNERIADLERELAEHQRIGSGMDKCDDNA